MQAMNVRGLLTSRRIVNMFGAIGYSVLVVTYVIVVVVMAIWLVRGGYSDSLDMTPAEGSLEVAPLESEAENTPILVSIFAYTVTTIMFLTVVFVTITLPYWLGKSSSFFIKRGLGLLNIPITSTSILLSKLVANGLVILPMLLIVAEDIAGIFTLLFVAGLTGVALMLFLIQHYLAKMTRLEAQDIW